MSAILSVSVAHELTFLSIFTRLAVPAKLPSYLLWHSSRLLLQPPPKNTRRRHSKHPVRPLQRFPRFRRCGGRCLPTRQGRVACWSRSAWWEVLNRSPGTEGETTLRLSRQMVRSVLHSRVRFRTDLPINAAGNRGVLIHQLTKHQTQSPFRRTKGSVERVAFHPGKPHLFVAVSPRF